MALRERKHRKLDQTPKPPSSELSSPSLSTAMVVKGYAKTSHGDNIRAQPISNYTRRQSAGAFPGDIHVSSNPLFINSLAPPAPLSRFHPQLSPGIVVKDHTETSHGLSNTIRAKPGSNDCSRLVNSSKAASSFTNLVPPPLSRAMVVKGHAKTSHGDTIRAQPGSKYSRIRSDCQGTIHFSSSPLSIQERKACSLSLATPPPLSWFRPRLSTGMVVKGHTEASDPGLKNSSRLSGSQGAIHSSSTPPLIRPETHHASSRRGEELSLGRKRAVLCGLLYNNSTERLKGCENDVYMLKKLLIELYGFFDSSIVILTENQAERDKYPTKCNIIRALKWLVQGCRSGDSLVFYFAGHGFRNSKGHNLELCSSDYESGPETIVDYELNETIIKPLPQGAKLHVVIDACNSGNALALPFRYKVHRRHRGHWNMYPHQLMTNGTNGGEVICFSACDDYQTAWEITRRVQSRVFKTGAMTFALAKAIFEKQPHPITYGELLHKIICTVRKVKRKKGGRLKQLPQLSSNKLFGADKKIFSL